MAILTIKTTKGDGIKKTIDKNSEDVALDILQRGIYAYPVESTIRELASNAYDAIKEREVAKSILTGKTTPEDHFDTSLEGDVYKDSKWDPTYFDLDRLSDDPNVYILYDEGDYNDILRIKDHGVGIGKRRMTGYFQLGWSSKRTQKGALGKWGLGSKVALSTGVDSFTVVSVYNGHKFRFEVYIDNIVSTTPKFGKNGPNDYIDVEVPQQTEEGGSKTFRFYYEETDDLNSLELIIPVKKHNKEKFFNAVESQLMYLPNIVFKYKAVGATAYEVRDIAAKILYKDDNIIISENSVYDKPHILLGVGDGYINYGFIAFRELELEEKKGSVGLILDINDVEVTPSRESVIWSPRTRKAIMNSYDKVVETATKMINNTLTHEPYFFSWIIKAAQVKSSITSNSNSNSDSAQAFQKLASILDPSSIKNIKYTQGTNNIAYSDTLDELIGKNVLIREFNYLRSLRKVERTKIKMTTSLANYQQFYITKNASNKYKDRYISEELASGSFVVIKLQEHYASDPKALLIEDDANLLDYDSVVVPEDIMDKYILEEADDGEITDDEGMVSITRDSNYLAKLRKKEQKVLYHEGYAADPISYSSKEVKIIDIHDKFKNKNVIYGTFGDRALINATFQNMPAYLVSFRIDTYRSEYYTFCEELKSDLMEFYDLKEHTPVLLSSDYEKYFISEPNFQHISDFIVESYKDGVIRFNKALRVTYTYYVIINMLHDYFNYSSSNISDSVASSFFEPNIQSIALAAGATRKRITSNLHGFYSACINFELNKFNGLDTSVLNQNLQKIDEFLPDQLCDKIDEITDIQLLDFELLNEVKAFGEFYGRFNSILNSINAYNYTSALPELKKYILQYETPPKIVRKF